nr:hypothetical protein [Acidobacteriota bacterium]
MPWLAGAAVIALVSSGAFAPQASVTREAIVLAEDRRAAQPGDVELLVSAARSREAALRALAIRALGRLEQSHASHAQGRDTIRKALDDRDAGVRRVAAYALAQSVTAMDAAARAPRRAELIAALAGERDDQVASALMESAARLADQASVTEVEAAILLQAAARGRGEGAASALEILARRARKPGVLSAASLAWLSAAVSGDALAPVSRRAALQAIVTSAALDPALAVILVHDAARPLITGAVITRCIDAAAEGRCVIAAI